MPFEFAVVDGDADIAVLCNQARKFDNTCMNGTECWVIWPLANNLAGLVEPGSVDPATEKPELHEVPGHSCNSGAQKSPKTTPREPSGNSPGGTPPI